MNSNLRLTALFFAFGLIFMRRHFGSQDHPAHKEGDYRTRQ